MIKQILKLLPIGMFLCILTGCSETQAYKTLYFAHSLPTSHPVHKGIVAMQQALEEQSSGKLKIKIFPDAQLGSEREVLELLQIGSIAMTKVSAASMANFAPDYRVLGLPYLFRDREHLFNVLEGEVGQQLLEGGSEFLLRGLCFYDAGSRSFYTKNKPIHSPDDLAGLKIRVMNDQTSVDMVNALGASATPMAYGELYTALQQNVVDGAENNVPSLVTSNHYEVCKYYTLDKHSMIPDVVLIGTKFWDTLSAQEKEWLQRAAKESVEKQKQFWQETVAEGMVLLKNAGVEIFTPDQALFSKKTESLKNKMAQEPRMKVLIEKIEKQ